MGISVWRKARILGKGMAFPGWLLLLFSLSIRTIDWLQRLEFIGRAMSDQAIALVKDWGWLAGIAWLALMLLWSAAQPDELDRVRALSRLQAACVNLALRVNAMLSLNDFRLSNEAAIESNYAEFRSAVHAVVNALMDAAPRERHEEYWRVLIGAFADLKQFHSDKPVTASEMEKILDSIVAHARDRGRLPPSR